MVVLLMAWVLITGITCRMAELELFRSGEIAEEPELLATNWQKSRYIRSVLTSRSRAWIVLVAKFQLVVSILLFLGFVLWPKEAVSILLSTRLPGGK